MKSINNKKNKYIGILFCLMSAACFGTMSFFATQAINNGGTSYTVACLRFLLCSVILFFVKIIGFPHLSFKINKDQIKAVLLVSVFYALTSCFLFTSYVYIDTSLASMLHFTYPIWTIFISSLIFKSKLNKLQFICLILTLMGVFFISNVKYNFSFLGIFLAFISGCWYASYTTFLNHGSLKKLSPIIISFWVSLIAGIEIFTVFFLLGKLNFSNITLKGYGFILLLVIFSTLIAIVLFQKGLFICGEIYATLLSTFEPTISVILGFVLLKERMPFIKFISGSLLILLSTVLIIFKNKFEKE